MASDNFAGRLLAWFEVHGRRDLPWQRPRSAYRVWVSEVMLQQTQVATVIPYFERFVARFPTVRALAEAGEDEVLHLWSGLGYYSRARNLHAAALRVVAEQQGRLPQDLEGWMALPGIGRSTAGAIVALSKGQRQPILDGNVKRVLCRYHGIDTWPGEGATEKTLWALAEKHTPTRRIADFTQAIMDLGATVCARTNPLCDTCPLRQRCRARLEQCTDRIPAPRPKRPRPVKATRFLILRNSRREVMLLKRPPSGIWGGLWGFPECALEDEPEKVCRRRFGISARATRFLRPRRHGFTHFQLDIEPVLLEVDGTAAAGVMEPGPVLWYNGASPDRLGLAAPVRAILDGLD